MSGYDLAIAYRIYPKVSKPALGLPFSDDKRRLAEICVRSLKESLGTLRARMWVLLDACPNDYAAIFEKYFCPGDLTFIHLPGVGNQATFAKQIDVLLEQSDSEFVYFAEDDYIYLPDQFSRMLEFMNANTSVDFISPYDHLDCYTLDIHDRPKWIRVSASHHWRTAASTCLTFLTSKKTLRQTEKQFRTYCRRNYDFSLWLGLTKQSIFNPLQAATFLYQQPLFAKVIAKAWFYGWKQILFGRRMQLWVPVPGLATHLDIEAMSPNVDWRALLARHGDDIAVDKLDRGSTEIAPARSCSSF
jgi:hypothetical protein